MAHQPGMGSDGLPHADLPATDHQSLFEAIESSGLDDADTYVLHRTEHCFALLNVFPYTSGHLMVLPKRATLSVTDLDAAIHEELWRLVRNATIAVKAAFSPHGINIGVNEGIAGGGSVPNHLHVHVVPRWSADTNFVTTVANARIIPEPLIDSWERLRKAWPPDTQAGCEPVRDRADADGVGHSAP